MKKKIDFNYDADTGHTIATLTTEYNTFIGEAQIHPDDPFRPSYSIGMDIAEARAKIQMYNQRIRDKKIEMKGVERLLCAIPKEKKNRHYAENLYLAMCNELDQLYQSKFAEQSKIKEVIRAREIYIRSRSTSKEDKEEFAKKIQLAFDALNKDKTD